jgi:hypothetical protein
VVDEDLRSRARIGNITIDHDAVAQTSASWSMVLLVFDGGSDHTATRHRVEPK